MRTTNTIKYLLYPRQQHTLREMMLTASIRADALVDIVNINPVTQDRKNKSLKMRGPCVPAWHRSPAKQYSVMYLAVHFA